MSDVPSEPLPNLGRRRQNPMLALREEMDDLLSRFFGGSEESWFGLKMSPAYDLSESENGLEVTFDLPGFKPEDIDVQIRDNMLTVRAERREEKTEKSDKSKTFHRIERRRGSYSRSVTLPCPVVEERVSAEYKDGVLTLSLPKCEQAKGRRIEIKSPPSSSAP